MSIFTTKQKRLFAKTPVAKKTGRKSSAVATELPVFVQTAMKNQAVIRSGNGSKKFSTTGDSFVDQFGKLGTYKAPRSFTDIEKDMSTLWAEDPLTAIKFALYLRTITRKVSLFDGSVTDEPQKGGELKHESIMRMLWLSQTDSDAFWKNIGLFVSLGSWHDIFTMLQYDLVYNGWEGRKLDWKQFGALILTALKNNHTSELVKKYLPQLKSNNACNSVDSQANNIIAKWICSLLFGKKASSYSYKQYRRLKTSGTAHEWQKLISKEKFNEIDFAKIHGRALNLLVRSKFLHNQNLSDKFKKWITKPETVVKYTGFVHELFAKLPATLASLDANSRETINKQFDTLVEKGKASESETKLIVVRDTSGSMRSTATGTDMTCFDIGKALALYFSEFLTGKFANSFIEFNSSAKMHTWKGKTALEKWYNDNTAVYGGTEFQAVIKLFAKLKQDGVDEADFPTGILCISDGEFNPASLGKTNVEAALETLRKAGFSKKYVSNFVIVLWNLQSGYYGKGTGEKFETYGGVPNVYYFSGYSAAVVSFLNGKVKNARELFDEALNQEILSRVTL